MLSALDAGATDGLCGGLRQLASGGIGGLAIPGVNGASAERVQFPPAFGGAGSAVESEISDPSFGEVLQHMGVAPGITLDGVASLFADLGLASFGAFQTFLGTLDSEASEKFQEEVLEKASVISPTAAWWVKGMFNHPSNLAEQMMRPKKRARWELPGAGGPAAPSGDAGWPGLPEQRGSNEVLLASERPPWCGGKHGAIPSFALPSSSTTALSGIKNALAIMGVDVPTELADACNSEFGEKTKRGQADLAAGALYGAVAPCCFPDDEDWRKIAPAAKLGQWVPKDMPKPPDAKCERSLATYLSDLIRVQQGAMWMWRQSPASCLAEIFQILEVAKDKSIPPAVAERAAVEYAAEVRRRIVKFAKSRPLKEADPQSYDLVQRAFFMVDSSAREKALSVVQGSGPARTVGSSSDYCLWYSIGKCTLPQCQKKHECPFCGSKKQSCLSQHLLEDVTRPRTIVYADAVKGGGKGTKAYGKNNDWKVLEQKHHADAQGRLQALIKGFSDDSQGDHIEVALQKLEDSIGTGGITDRRARGG